MLCFVIVAVRLWNLYGQRRKTSNQSLPLSADLISRHFKSPRGSVKMALGPFVLLSSLSSQHDLAESWMRGLARLGETWREPAFYCRQIHLLTELSLETRVYVAQLSLLFYSFLGRKLRNVEGRV